MKKVEDFFNCPYCGEKLKRNAISCNHCGSDNLTGWSDNTYLDGIDLDIEDDEYEEIKNSEFGSNKKRKISWIALTGGILVVTFILFLLQNFR